MDFGDLKSKAGQQLLNNYLADKSYLSGYAPSAQDFTTFDAMGVAPSGKNHATPLIRLKCVQFLLTLANKLR
jgi:elongation factor 1-beta